MIGQFNTLAFWTPGPFEMIVILIVAVLIFGRRLPEIARNMGKSVSEFKKGIKEAGKAKDEIIEDVREAGEDVDMAATAAESTATESSDDDKKS